MSSDDKNEPNASNVFAVLNDNTPYLKCLIKLLGFLSHIERGDINSEELCEAIAHFKSEAEPGHLDVQEILFQLFTEVLKSDAEPFFVLNVYKFLIFESFDKNFVIAKADHVRHIIAWLQYICRGAILQSIVEANKS